jgi:hypothetical protein
MQAEFTPNLETVMQVVSVIMDDKAAREFLCRHFPDYAPMFRKQEEGGYELINTAGFMQSLTKEDFIVYIMASCGGVKKSRLVEKIGELAERSLQKLTTAGMIEVKEDLVLNKVRNTYFANNVDETLHLMGLALAVYDRERVNARGSHYVILAEKLNQDGFEAAHSAMAECRRRLQEIFLDPKYNGDRLYINVLSASFLD